MKPQVKSIYYQIKSIISRFIDICRWSIIRVSKIKGYNNKNTFLISSSPRSGSTWLGEIMMSIPRSCIVFEPLHLRFVPEAKKAGFNWHTYKEEDEEWPEGKTFLVSAFNGKIINSWTYRENNMKMALFSKNIIVKCVRANRLLPWISNNFKINPPILLMRHPCAVVASQLKSEVWQRGGKPSLPGYLNDYPVFKDVVSRLDSIEEYLAAIWAMDQLPALMHPTPYPWIIITYEELVFDPKTTFDVLFKRLNLNIDIEKALARIKKPSTVVYKTGISGRDGWKKQLSTEQVEKILSVTKGFGLHFYDINSFPNLKILHDKKLFSTIKEYGIRKPKNLGN